MRATLNFRSAATEGRGTLSRHFLTMHVAACQVSRAVDTIQRQIGLVKPVQSPAPDADFNPADELACRKASICLACREHEYQILVESLSRQALVDLDCQHVGVWVLRPIMDGQLQPQHTIMQQQNGSNRHSQQVAGYGTPSQALPDVQSGCHQWLHHH